MIISARHVVLCVLSAVLLLLGPVGAHDSLDGNSPALQIEEATFEANGSPLYVLNARVRVKNVSEKGYRGSTAHFFFRLEENDSWTLIDERPLPGIPPGNFAVCDLVTSSEGLPIVDSNGEVRPCEYRIEVHYGEETTAEEGHFHPSCIHDGDDHDHDEHHSH